MTQEQFNSLADSVLSIPLADWDEASSCRQQGGRKKQKRQCSVGLRHFTYSLHDKALIKIASQEAYSLFWHYIQATEENVSEQYLVLQMDDENTEALLLEDSRDASRGRTYYSYDTDVLREKILMAGIRVEKAANKWTQFHYMGSSNSQVQQHIFVFRQAKTLLENQQRLQCLLPEVANLTSIPKRVKYTGLLFSGVTPVDLPSDLNVKEIRSFKNKNFDFTDGPGLISLKLAKWIARKLKNLSEQKPPSVFQIRYCGMLKRLDGTKQGFICKGVLLVDPRNTSTYEIQVRESMLKTRASHQACSKLKNILGICAESSRSSPGRIGQQMICLLSETVVNEDFEALQQEYAEHARNCSIDLYSMTWMLAFDGIKGIGKDFRRLVEQCLAKRQPWSPNSKETGNGSFGTTTVADGLIPNQLKNHRDPRSSLPTTTMMDKELLDLYKKCALSALSSTRRLRNKTGKAQIPIAASRNLFGAVFPETLNKYLQEGECVVMLEDGPFPCSEDKETFVMVSRSPSYHPGDIRMLRVKPLPDTHPVLQLRNCILFATKGNRPDPDKMGGGDLDGDIYLVIFHPTLLKYAGTLKSVKAAKYEDPPKSKGNETPSNNISDLIHYVAQTDNSMLGEVETTFYKVAKRFGVSSEEIRRLNQLFASLVDRNPASLDHFQKLKSSVVHESRSQQNCAWESLGELQILLYKDIQHHYDSLADEKGLLRSFECFQRSLEINNRTISSEKMTLLYQHIQWTSKDSELEALLKSPVFIAVSNDTSDCASEDSNDELEESGLTFEDRQRLCKHEFEEFQEFHRRGQKLFEDVLSQNAGELIVPLSDLRDEKEKQNKLDHAKDQQLKTLEEELSLMEQRDQMSLEQYRRDLLSRNDEFSQKEAQMLQARCSVATRINMASSEKTALEDRLQNCSSSNWILNAMINAFFSSAESREEISNLEDSVRRKDSELRGLRHQREVLDRKLAAAKQSFRKAEYTLKEARTTLHKELKFRKQQLLDYHEAVTQKFENLMSGSDRDDLSRLISDVKKDMNMLDKKTRETDEHLIHEKIAMYQRLVEYKDTNLRHLTTIQQTMMDIDALSSDAEISSGGTSSLLQTVDLDVCDLGEQSDWVVSIALDEIQTQTNYICVKLEKFRDDARCVFLIKEEEFVNTGYVSVFESVNPLLRRCSSLLSIVDKSTEEIQVGTRTALEQLENDSYKHHAAFSQLIIEMMDKIDDGKSLLWGVEQEELKKAIEEFESALRCLKDEYSSMLNKGLVFTTWDSRYNHLKAKMKIIENIHDNFFCPNKLEHAEKEVAELQEKKEGITFCKDTLLKQIKSQQEEWNDRISTVEMTKSQRSEEWLKTLSKCDRTFKLEENRLLGFPREDKRGGPLPVYFKRFLLKKKLTDAQALVITADTGSGKSTQVPQYIADDFHLYGPRDSSRPIKICCTQPRRVAAQGVAQRVAEEYLTKLGELVGFQVGTRGRSAEECAKHSENTAIEFVTEGLLLFRMTKSKDFILRYDCVIIDEMHERNMEQDLCLSILRKHLKEYKRSRPEFKLVIMSASIDAKSFSEYLGGCPILDCPGRLHEIIDIYKDDCIGDDVVAHSVDTLFSEILTSRAESDDGDVLIFLSGAQEIDDCVSRIRSRASKEGVQIDAYPLYSKLPHESIKQATEPSHRRKGSRKVICSTNLAETSLTIDGVTFVIESGLARKMRYCHELRCSALKEERISQASIRQRRGRAGRTKRGTCYYLYSKRNRLERTKYDMPQILESSVDSLILLSLDICGSSIEHLGLLECPGDEEIASAKRRLLDLELVEQSENGLILSDDGKHARSLSMLQPESVRMILNAVRKYPRVADKAIKLAVILSNEDSIYERFAKERDPESFTSHSFGDHLLALRHFEYFETAKKLIAKKSKKLRSKCQDRGLRFQILNSIQEDVQRCHQVLKRRKLYPSSSQSGSNSMGNTDETLLRVAVAGYFHRLVEFFDSQYAEKLSFRVIGLAGMLVFLDRDSCLIEKFQKRIKPSYVDDDDGGNEGEETERNQSDACLSFSSLVETVEPGFMFYGNLFKPTKGSPFMLDASVVEGKWILEEASRTWKERVSFNPFQKKLVQRVFRNISGKFLRSVFKDTTAIEEALALKYDLEAASIHRDYNCVHLIGKQENVIKAGEDVLLQLRQKEAAISEKDSEKNYATELVYGKGMRVKGCIPERKTSHYQILQAWGLKQPKVNGQICIRVSVENFKNLSQSVAFGILTEAREDTITWKKICDTLKGSLNDEIRDLNNRLDDFQKQRSHKIDRESGKASPKSKRGKPKTYHKPRDANSDTTKVQLDKEIESLRKKKRDLNQIQNMGRLIRIDTIMNSFVFVSNNDAWNLPQHFKELVESMANAARCHSVTCASAFAPFQRRRHVALLKELRQGFPGGLVQVVSIKTLDGETIARDYSVGEFEWLSQTTKAIHVQSIQVLGTTICKSEAPKLAKALDSRLSQNFREETEEEANTSSWDDGIKMKDCVMCRRPVQISPGKENVTDQGPRLQGARLHLCGCCYCRACFVSCAKSSLSNDFSRSVNCMLCKKQVLAQDCWNLIGRFSKAEWNSVCRLADDAYCKNPANITKITSQMRKGRIPDRPRGSLKCPSCSTSMIHADGYVFVSCRNKKCKQTICTRCHHTIECEADLNRCKSSHCNEAED